MVAIRVVIPWLMLCSAAVPCTASATNYTLWINGRGGGGVVGDYKSFTYWGPAATTAGVNKKAVNWDGTSSIASQNGKIRDALDCFCTGNNWCYIATHDAGDLMIGYLLITHAEIANAALEAGASDIDKPFYEGKVAAAEFFARNMLPELSGVRTRIEGIDLDVMELDEAAF